MRTIFILLIAYAIFVLTAFDAGKCDHAFTIIQQPEIKVEVDGHIGSSIYTAPTNGKQVGPELICVKCFHKQRQIIDYGDYKPVFLGGSGWQIDLKSRDTAGVILGSFSDSTIRTKEGFWLGR